VVSLIKGPTAESELVNGVGYNLARFIVGNKFNIPRYAELTEGLALDYLNSHNGVSPAQAHLITVQYFSNEVLDYATEHWLIVDELLEWSKAHALYFLCYESNPEKHYSDIEEVVRSFRRRDLISDEAQERLDSLVFDYVQSHKDISGALHLMKPEYVQ